MPKKTRKCIFEPTLSERLSARAVAAAKKTTKYWTTPALHRDETRVAEQKFSMRAQLILMGADGLSEQRFLARVPCVITTVPELPEAILCEDHCFVLTRTYPLTYTSVLAAKATRIL